MRAPILFAVLLLALLAPKGAAADEAWDVCAQGVRGGADWDRQIAGCDRVLARGSRETSANRAIAFENRSIAHTNKGDYDRAIADAGEAIRSKPDYSDAYYGRCAAYKFKGDYDRAIADCDKAISLKPDLSGAFVNLGGCYLAKHEYDRAIANYNEAIRLNPSYTDGIVGRGLVYEAKGDRTRALADFETALSYQPDNHFAIDGRDRLRSNLSEAWNACAQGSRGGADWDRQITGCNDVLASGARETTTNRATALENRSIAHTNKGEYDIAVADASEAIRLDPNMSDAYYGRCAAYKYKGDYDRAIADCDKAINLKPDLAGAFLNLAGCYLAKHDYDRSLATYSEALRLNPSYADGYAGRGLVYEAKGDYTRALADFETALSHQADNRFAVEGRDRMREKIGSAASAPPAQPSQVASCAGSRRVALVIGNSAYGGGGRLDNPVNDADDVSALLRDKLCFSVILAKDATLSTFLSKLNEFSKTAQGADVALFYFAGHGMQFQGVNYLLPIDPALDNEIAVTHGNISAQEVVNMLDGRARFTLVFLDACRNNPYKDELSRQLRVAQRGGDEKRGLAPMSGGSETLIVFATRPDKSAKDGAGRNSPFATAFLEKFATPGEDVELVLRDVTARVSELTDKDQVPQRLTELQHGLTLLPLR